MGRSNHGVTNVIKVVVTGTGDDPEPRGDAAEMRRHVVVDREPAERHESGPTLRERTEGHEGDGEEADHGSIIAKIRPRSRT
jgi:hypothetical protein